MSRTSSVPPLQSRLRRTSGATLAWFAVALLAPGTTAGAQSAADTAAVLAATPPGLLDGAAATRPSDVAGWSVARDDTLTAHLAAQVGRRVIPVDTPFVCPDPGARSATQPDLATRLTVRFTAADAAIVTLRHGCRYRDGIGGYSWGPLVYLVRQRGAWVVDRVGMRLS